jgi:hypothetical protein
VAFSKGALPVSEDDNRKAHNEMLLMRLHGVPATKMSHLEYVESIASGANPQKLTNDNESVDELASVIWSAMRPSSASWVARLSWLNVSPQERAAGIARGVDPDNYDDSDDVDQARKIARAVLAHLQNSTESN